MTDWRRLLIGESWQELDNFWRRQTPEVCAQILGALHKVVPTVVRTNGTEREQVFAEPHEVAERLAGAAKILSLGELEAAANADGPPTCMQQWSQLSDEVLKTCLDLRAMPEVTEGVIHMSRAHHVKQTAELIADINFTIRSMLYTDEADEEEPDDLAPSLQEHMATAAIYAFAAGRHFQLALGKETEPDAVRGLKILTGAREGGVNGGRQKKVQSEEILAEMGRLREARQDLSVNAIATIVHLNGKGTSPGANAKLWGRYRQKTVT